MSTLIEFYFDFSSPYGYLAADQIDDFAAKHDCTVAWKPYLMGAAMKQTGRGPLVEQPIVGDYARHDLARFARLQGTPLRLPDVFPVASVAACRLFYWLRDADPDSARTAAKALYRAYFADNRNIGDKQTVIDIAAELGHDREGASAALDDPAIKQRLREVTDDAIGRGVFGSPYFLVDGEPFWGADRLWMIKRWIKSGGW